MPDGVLDRWGAALRHRHQREAVEPGVVRDRLQVADPSLQRVVVDLPVGEPVAALVVADDRGEAAEVAQEVLPDRALPVVLQLAEPAGGDEQRGPGAVHGVCDPHPVRRATEPDALGWRLRTGHAPIVGSRTSVW